MTLDDSGMTCDFTHQISNEPKDRETNCKHSLKNISRRGPSCENDGPRVAFWITLLVDALTSFFLGFRAPEVALSMLTILPKGTGKAWRNFFLISDTYHLIMTRFPKHNPLTNPLTVLAHEGLASNPFRLPHIPLLPSEKIIF